MKVWLKEVKGMWVVTLAEGRMLGTVNGLYLDPLTKKVTGFLIRVGSPLSGAERWISVGQVKKIGEDLIFLENDSTAAASEPMGRRLSTIVNMPVSGKDGRALGHVSDLAVETETWQMAEIGLEQDASVVLNFSETVMGDDLILVQSGVAPQARPLVKKRENIMETVLGKDFIKQTSDAMRRMLKGAEARLNSLGEKPPKNPAENASARSDKSDVDEKK